MNLEEVGFKDMRFTQLVPYRAHLNMERPTNLLSIHVPSLLIRRYITSSAETALSNNPVEGLGHV
jgi:hypothetical protein